MILKRFVVMVLLAGLTAACSPRGMISYLPLPAAAGEELVRVFVATNRNSFKHDDVELVRQQFGDRRSDVLRFGQIDISIPPVHELGQIEWPGHATPDPQRHFVTRNGKAYETQAAFLRDVRAEQGDSKELLLFVHGFNVNVSESIYRLAQLSYDYDSDMPAIAYSWASAGDPRGYVYDRDSVIFSRDGLEEVLTLFANDRWNIHLVAHSMGSQLVMETLRQMSISGKQRILKRIETLALISPDIDEDVFVQQASRIDPFPKQTVLMVSSKDRALGLSAWLTGKPRRLGSIADQDLLGDLPVEVIDLSDIEGGDRTGHATAFTAPVAIRLLRRLQNATLSAVLP